MSTLCSFCVAVFLRSSSVVARCSKLTAHLACQWPWIDPPPAALKCVLIMYFRFFGLRHLFLKLAFWRHDATVAATLKCRALTNTPDVFVASCIGVASVKVLISSICQDCLVC